MRDHFEEVRRRARQKRMQPKPPARPKASTSGAEAFRQGSKLGDNPHHPSDPEHAMWREEWFDARNEVT